MLAWQGRAPQEEEMAAAATLRSFLRLRTKKVIEGKAGVGLDLAPCLITISSVGKAVGKAPEAI